MRPPLGRRLERGRALDRCEGPRGQHRDALRLVRHQPPADRRTGARQGPADHRRRHERPAVHCRDRRPDRVRLGAVRPRTRRRNDRLHRYTLEPDPPDGGGKPHVDRERDERRVHERPRRRRDPLLGREQERERPVQLRQRPEEAASSPAGTGRPAGADRLAQRVRHRRRARQPGAAEASTVLAQSGTACGGPGYLYTADTSPGATCRVGFTAEVDTGVERRQGEITVQPVGTAVSPVPGPVRHDGRRTRICNGDRARITVLPNHTASGSDTSRTTIRSARRT